MKPRKSVVVTDLDNTLYDWVEDWHRLVGAPLLRLVSEFGIDRQALIRATRDVFARHDTDEYALLFEELCVSPLLAGHPDARARLRAMIAPGAAAERRVRPYPRVADTLRRLRAAGTRIVGYTESMACYALPRLARVGLAEAFDLVYARDSHPLHWPEGPLDDLLVIANCERARGAEAPAFLRLTPSHALKPDPGILAAIVDDLGAARDAVVYVGDSLRKDVAMAQAVGIDDVHARYGTAPAETSDHDWLSAVSRFSLAAPVAVAEEGAPIRPTCVLEVGFHELESHFTFEEFVPQRHQGFA